MGNISCKENNSGNAYQVEYSNSISKPLFVASIDFGTTFSGYAYMTRDEFYQDRRVHVKTWSSNSSMKYKAPTAVLFNKGKKFHSFGYQAEHFFHENVGNSPDNIDTKDWFFFKHVKKTLLKNQIDFEQTLLDVTGTKTMLASDVVAQILKFLRDDLLQNLERSYNGVSYTDIQWILTVPAIWNLKAIQFIRNSAEKSGIPTDQQTIVEEPEAAALYCGKRNLNITTKSCGLRFFTDLPEGSRYLVLDLGGGTIDITIHIKGEGSLEHALGIPWGGLIVNDCFVDFCIDLFGKQTFADFRQNEPEDYLDLLNDFEHKKLSVTVENLSPSSQDIRLRLPVSLSQLCDPNRKWKDKLIIKPDEFRSFYNKSLCRLEQELSELLLVPEIANISTVMAVGGFAESSVVINHLKQKFINWNIIVPVDPGLAVLEGAVLYGFKYAGAKPIVHNNHTKNIPPLDMDAQVFVHNHFNNVINTIPERNTILCFLLELMGDKVLNKVRREHEDDYNELFVLFHKKIKECKECDATREDVKFVIPFTWRDVYLRLNNISLEYSIIKRNKYNGELRCLKDKLIIVWTLFKNLFLLCS